MDSIDSPLKKANRVFYTLGFIEFTFISVCLFLLLLDQYVNNIVDNYSPAYNTVYDDDATSFPTTISTTNSPTNSPKNLTSSKNFRVLKEEKTVRMFIPKKIPTMYATTLRPTTDIRNIKRSTAEGILNNYSKANTNDLNTSEGNYKPIIQNAKGSYLITDEPVMGLATESLTNGPHIAMHINPQPKEDWIKVFISNLAPGSASFKIKRDRNFTDKEKEDKKAQTRLSNLLIMYPCCIAAIILLCMQLISRLKNDIGFKSTMILFVFVPIALGITIFAASVAESVTYTNSISILIAVSSAIFVNLLVVDFILLLKVM